MPFPYIPVALTALGTGMGLKFWGEQKKAKAARRTAQQQQQYQQRVFDLLRGRQEEALGYLRPRVRAGGVGYGADYVPRSMGLARRVARPRRETRRRSLDTYMASLGLRRGGPAIHARTELERGFDVEDMSMLDRIMLHAEEAKLQDFYKAMRMMYGLSEGRGLPTSITGVPGKGLGIGRGLWGVGDTAETLAGYLLAIEADKRRRKDEKEEEEGQDREGSGLSALLRILALGR